MTAKKKHRTVYPSTSASANETTGEQRRSKALDDVASTSLTTTSSKCRQRSRKKPRPANNPTLDDTSPGHDTDTKPTDPLTFLPLELLREILVGTRSTRDVLSVARCNKQLWKTLTGSPADFIWKGTRQVALPQPLPDPPCQLSESAYAAMVFDGGLCEICQQYTKVPYRSFALKLRICKNDKCQDMKPERHFFKLLTGKDLERVKKRTPTIEVDNLVFDKTFDEETKEYWPRAAPWCRTQEWVRSVRDSNPGEVEVQGSAEELERQHQEAVKKNKEWMEFCVALRKWKETYDTKSSANKKSNEKLARDIARANKLNADNLIRTSFGVLHLIRNKCLEPLTTDDFDAVAATVKEELEALATKRKVSQRWSSYRKVWEAVQSYYHQLRSGSSKVVLPPFSTFRRLPTLASLLTIADFDTSKSIQEILKQNGLRDVITIELRKWESDARRNMAALLGYPDWTSGSENETNEEPKVIHPADRATARFLCKACTERAREHGREIECLTFVKACSHECPTVDGKKERFTPWDASTFVKDDKAVAAIKRALEVCELDEANTLWEVLGERQIKCTSCKPFSFMTFDDLIVHCRRHENMEIASGNEEEIEATLKPLMEYISRAGRGNANKLMMRGKKQRDMKDCGCKHCAFSEALKFPDKDVQTLLKGMRKMTVNGLRSHLKAKHGYTLLRDEDVFIFLKAEGDNA